jgi:hypothetical protein
VFFNNAGIEAHAPIAAPRRRAPQDRRRERERRLLRAKHADPRDAQNTGPARGSIINTASVAGPWNGPGSHVASKTLWPG